MQDLGIIYIGNSTPLVHISISGVTSISSSHSCEIKAFEENGEASPLVTRTITDTSSDGNSFIFRLSDTEVGLFTVGKTHYIVARIIRTSGNPVTQAYEKDATYKFRLKDSGFDG
jgi:hypothetical protein